MALEYAHGVITYNGTDAVGTTKTVSGLSFQPKAIRFVYWLGSTGNNPTDAVGDTGHNARPGIGFCTSLTNRYALGSKSDDGVSTGSTSATWTDSGVVIGPANSSLVFKADINAINSDGFQIISEVAGGAGATIFWEAWGGSDITVAAALLITEPATTGNQDHTVTGFTASGTDQVVMFAGVNTASATPDAVDNAADSGFMVGFANGGNSGDNVVVVANSDDLSDPTDTDGYCKTGECLAMIVTGGGNPNAQAQLTQFNADGFRLNWIARAVTGRVYIALAIKGGRWKAGSYTIDPTSVSNTATVSSPGFQPSGVLLMGRMTAEDTAGTATTQARMSLGRASSTTSRSCYGYLDADNAGTTDVNWAFEYDQILVFPNNVGAVQTAYDLDAFLSTGFRIIVDVADGTLGASEWQAFLAFASSAAIQSSHAAIAAGIGALVSQARPVRGATASATGSLTTQVQRVFSAAAVATGVATAATAVTRLLTLAGTATGVAAVQTARVALVVANAVASAVGTLQAQTRLGLAGTAAGIAALTKQVSTLFGATATGLGALAVKLVQAGLIPTLVARVALRGAQTTVSELRLMGAQTVRKLTLLSKGRPR